MHSIYSVPSLSRQVLSLIAIIAMVLSIVPLQLTYAATEASTLTVTKNLVGYDATDWSFSFSGEGITPFSLTDSHPAETFSVAPGLYTITESVVSDWTLDQVECSEVMNEAKESLQSTVSGQSFSILIEAGKNYECVVTNTFSESDGDKTGRVTLMKYTAELDDFYGEVSYQGSDWSFDFIGFGSSTTTLTNTGTNVYGDFVVGAPLTITEVAVDNWELSDVRCTYGYDPEIDAPIEISLDWKLGDHTFSIDPMADEEITCIVTNIYKPTPIIIEPVASCSVTIVSDETNTVVEKGGGFAKKVTTIHPNWQASVSDAHWIWGDNPVNAPTSVSETQTFEKTFFWNGPITAVELQIASDNYYVVNLNGNQIGAAVAPQNFWNAVSYTSFATFVQNGTNTLSVAVTNEGLDKSTPASNPAGLLYKLVVTGNSNDDCTKEIIAEEERYTLTIDITGEGSGTVYSDDEKIFCTTAREEGDVCTYTYPVGTAVVLSVVPDQGSNFNNSWTIGGGTCTDNTTLCTVTMNQSYSLVAHFDLDDTASGPTTTSQPATRTTGTRIDRSAAPVPMVAGVSTSTSTESPMPLVLGEQVSIVPVGAPNTGAGGTASLVIVGQLLVAPRRLVNQ